MPSYHPAMLGEFTKADLFTPIDSDNGELNQLLMRHELTMEDIVELLPNVQSFMIVRWYPNSRGAAQNKPETIRFVDSDGNGFTLGSGSIFKWYTSWISKYEVRYEAMNHPSFEEMKQWLNKAFKK